MVYFNYTEEPMGLSRTRSGLDPSYRCNNLIEVSASHYEITPMQYTAIFH